jgi:uracil DNA glycosylase
MSTEELLDLTETFITDKTKYIGVSTTFWPAGVIPKNIKVVIIGQDPYYSFGKGEAMGLSFSVPINVKIPKTLENIFKNMLNFKHIEKYPDNGDLSILKYQGCFFINTHETWHSIKNMSDKNRYILYIPIGI